MNKLLETGVVLKELIKRRRRVLSFLRFSRRGTQPKGGSVDNEESEALKELAQKAEKFEGPIIEIGTLFGFSTQALAIGKNQDKKLITVDRYTWNPIGIPSWRHEELTRKNLYYLTERCNVEIYAGDSNEFYESYSGEPPSLVFIDAGHDYDSVKNDIDWAVRKEAKIISGHDYSDRHPGVKKAVDEALGQSIEIAGTVWYTKDRVS